MNMIHQLYQWLKPIPLDIHSSDEYQHQEGGPLYHRGYGFEVRSRPSLWLDGIALHHQDKNWFISFAEHKLGCVVWDCSADNDNYPNQGVMLTLEEWITLWGDPITLEWKDKQDPTLYNPKDAVKKCRKIEWYAAHPDRLSFLMTRYQKVNYNEPLNRLHSHYFHADKGYWEDMLFFMARTKDRPVLCITNEKQAHAYANVRYVSLQESDHSSRFWVHKQTITDHVSGIRWSVRV